MLKTKLKIFTGDILGGINSAIVALPQALAFGVATGFGASAGIWGTIILCIVAGLFGAKIPLLSGITGPSTIVIASILHSMGTDTSAVIGVILLAGIFQTILALTSLPMIVKYVPYPVISGFMNGIGIIIIIMQINPIIGAPIMSNTITSIETFVQNINNINQDALFIGLITLAIVFLIPKKFNKIIPAQALALIICTIISIKMGLDLEKISNISISFPSINVPKFNFRDCITYINYAFMLTIVLSSESLLTGLVADSLMKTRSSTKKMLLGQGIGNILCSLTGTLPGSAATMRTVAAINSGATTRLTVIVNPAILLILLYIFADFVAEIPLAVLAGILIKIGYDIIDTKLLKVIKYAPKDDLYILLLVFFLTVFYNLIVAVGAGITFAALLYAKRTADSAKLVQKTIYDKDIEKIEKILDKDYKHKIRVVHIDGQFFFGSATQLVAQFEELWGTKFLILDYSAGNLLDISAIFALEDIIFRLKSQKIKVLLVVHLEEIAQQLKEHKILEQIGEDKVFTTESEAIEYAKQHLKDKIKRRRFWRKVR